MRKGLKILISVAMLVAIIVLFYFVSKVITGMTGYMIRIFG
jgi:hypothetical protein